MKNHGWLSRLFQPPAEPRSLPYTRPCKIALRTAHLMATSVLVGGHAFEAPPSALLPWLYAAVASGVGMVLFEAYPSMNFLFQGWGLMLLAKLALLCAIPFAGKATFPVLLAVVALASIASHMPGRFRHYSVLDRNVIQ
jgi:hypothetical protein